MTMSVTPLILSYFPNAENGFGPTCANLETAMKYSRYWCLHQPKWAQSCNCEDTAGKTQFIMLDLCQNKTFTENTSVEKQFAQQPYFFNVTVHVVQASCLTSLCRDRQSIFWDSSPPQLSFFIVRNNFGHFLHLALTTFYLTVSTNWNTGVNSVTCRLWLWMKN